VVGKARHVIRFFFFFFFFFFFTRKGDIFWVDARISQELKPSDPHFVVSISV
jgi:hypothetical protein